MATNKKMRAAVIAEGGRVKIEKIAMPAITNDYQCLAKMLAATTCSGTDVRFATKIPQFINYILGHETVGRIIKTGKKVRNFKVGDRVLRPTAVYSASKLDGRGSAFGGFAEFGIVSDRKAALEDGFELAADELGYSKYQQAVPKDIPSLPATMLITLKETLCWTQQFDIPPRSAALIFGDGSVAQFYVWAFKISGLYPVIVAGHWDDRLKRCVKLGADLIVNTSKKKLQDVVETHYGSRPVIAVIDTVGNNDLINEALPLMGNNSQYAVYGSYDDPKITIDRALAPTFWKFSNFYMDESATHEQVIDYARRGLVKLEDLYDAVLPFSKVNDAIHCLKNRQYTKVVFTF